MRRSGSGQNETRLRRTPVKRFLAVLCFLGPALVMADGSPGQSTPQPYDVPQPIQTPRAAQPGQTPGLTPRLPESRPNRPNRPDSQPSPERSQPTPSAPTAAGQQVPPPARTPPEQP